MKPLKLALVLATVLSPVQVVAQQPHDAVCAAGPLGAEAASRVLGELETALRQYVDPARSQAAIDTLRREAPRYRALSDRAAFTGALTQEIGAVLADKHFYVRTASAAGPPAVAHDPAARAAAEAAINYGIEAARRLPGNVGYLDLRMMGMSEPSAARIDAAMDLLQDTEALIIDLRNNRGGGGQATSALIGRLASKPIPRSVIHWRQADGSFERMEQPTRAYPKDKLYDRPVYLLTANFTISSAEAFAYDLKAAGRAVVVGETTRGGANPMNRPLFELGCGLRAYVANGRSEHPVTKGTANGAGVVPDVAVAPADALLAAYRAALGARSPDGATPELARAKSDPEAALKAALL